MAMAAVAFAALMGVDEAIEQVSLVGTGLGRRPLVAVGGQVLGHGGPGPLEGAVGCRHAGVQGDGRLGRRSPEHVSQDERGALRGGSTCSAARKASSIVSRRHHLGVGLIGSGPELVEQVVGVGLEPGHLRERVQLDSPPTALAELVEAHVGGDAVEPRPGRVPSTSSKVSRARQARRKVSCTASSASSNDASIR